MIACVVTLALGCLACVAVLAVTVRHQQNTILRLAAAVAAPNRTAAQHVLTSPTGTLPEPEPRPSPLIGA